jgi:hypothetical protein
MTGIRCAREESWLVVTQVTFANWKRGGAESRVAVADLVPGSGRPVLGGAQLRRFRADPANNGRVSDTGLWRHSGHPNYFGDACLWWGRYLLACRDRGSIAANLRAVDHDRAAGQGERQADPGEVAVGPTSGLCRPHPAYQRLCSVAAQGGLNSVPHYN